MPHNPKEAIAHSPAAMTSNNTAHPTPVPYLFRGHEVRMLIGNDGQPRWIAADVATILGLGRTHDMVRALDDDERGTDTVRTPSGDQTMTTINEPGLYSCILRSRKPDAREFKRWIVHEVLPSLRKTGTYSVQPAASEDQVIAQALHILDTRLKERDAEVAALAPKAEAYDQFIDCEGTFSVGTVAKMLGVGPNRLFKMLRDQGIFLEHGPRRNTPRQTYARHFSVKAAIYGRPSGIDGVSYTTHVLPSGVDLIRRLLADDLPGAPGDLARPTLQPH